MIKHEQKFTTKLVKYLRHHPFFTNAIVEVKVCLDNRFYFSSGSFPKELGILLMAPNKFVYKFSDIGALGSPCDIIVMSKWSGYLIISYDKNSFYVIAAEAIKGYMKAGHKSMNESEADMLCSYRDTIKPLI
jgi:hypothetical protein